MKKLILLFIFVLQSSMVMGDEIMNQAMMEEIVKNSSQDAKGENGFVEFVYKDVRMYLISDTTHNRMRIISPIIEYKDVTKEQLDAIMESNFHTALDARYGVRKGVLYSAYVHPLSALSEEQIKSALVQVANLALSFGSDYSSGLLTYEENRKKKNKTKSKIKEQFF